MDFNYMVQLVIFVFCEQQNKLLLFHLYKIANKSKHTE